MPTNKLNLLFYFLLLNITLVIVNFTGAGQNIWGFREKISMQPLIALNTTIKDSQRWLRGASLNPIHPFEQLSKSLEQFEWDAKRIDEAILKYWKTEKTFLRPQADNTILSTSCLHTAAWIVPGLLELQTRPNSYRGRYKRPTDKDLIVYDNTQEVPSAETAPVIQSLKSFIDSRPSDEPILLQVDLYQLKNRPSSGYYIDHHFAIHVYKGEINLYHSWQDIFNLIDWMKSPEAFKLRYSMPIETFYALFETAFTHTGDYFQRDRLEAIWKVFGITETFIDGPTKRDLDPVVRKLRYPWIVSLITHWPSPVK